MIKKNMLLLANSRKHSERCLAGREFSSSSWQGWVRPVSAREGEGLNSYERKYRDDGEPAVLDLIEVPLIRANPHSCQTENWLVSPDDWWTKIGNVSWDNAYDLAESPEELWFNGQHTYLGINDEIPWRISKSYTSSLCLIYAPSVDISVSTSFDKTKVRAAFSYRDVRYNLSLTDSIWEPHFRGQGRGTYRLNDCLLTISLSEPFKKNGGEFYQYKLVAAAIPRQQ